MALLVLGCKPQAQEVPWPLAFGQLTKWRLPGKAVVNGRAKLIADGFLSLHERAGNLQHHIVGVAREAVIRIEDDGRRAAEITSHLKSFYKKDVSLNPNSFCN